MSAASDVQPPAAMSVDVEDWFQVENLRAAVSRDSWDDRELRVHDNTARMLDIFETSGVRATFFVLGWVAERLPDLVKSIHAAGHEIAAHGSGHDLVYSMQPDEFRQDVRRSKSVLEDLISEPVRGYRAPCFSITDWAIDILHDEGFEYDSSSFPTVYHERYGRLTGAGDGQITTEIRPGFTEVCISGLRVRTSTVPWGGGGYFRLLPYRVYRAGLERILANDGAFVFYMHPWEIDPGQPRIRNIKASHKFRHYLNLSRTEGRLARLSQEFTWTTIGDLIEQRKSVTPAATP